MPTSIITTDDLREFKMELLDDIKDLLGQTGYWETQKIPEILRSDGNAPSKSQVHYRTCASTVRCPIPKWAASSTMIPRISRKQCPKTG